MPTDATFTPFVEAIADSYVVERELGRGGMAVVFLATDCARGRQVALKVLHPDVGAAIGRERFQREIRIAAELQHPHILALHDSGERAGFLWYTMPYVAGASLAARVATERQLPIADAVQITTQVLDALTHAHARDVIHRDIKPENILLHEGHAILADFGIARASGALASDPLTATGITLGTPHYMSPEQSMGDRVDARSDVYAVGCVLYAMLAGEPPHTGPNWQAIITRRLTEPVRPLRAVRSTVPAPLEAVVLRALATSAADRWPTAADFRDALRDTEARASTAAVPALAAPSTDAVAVLDFRNLSRDPAVEWLGGGIAETVTADLKRVTRVKVVAREAIARALGDGTERTTREASAVGARVGARWLVSGGYQVLGPRVRITAQFEDVASRELVGAVKLDGALEEIFALQDRIVAELLASLNVPLSTTDEQAIAAPETHDVVAYEWYVKGRQQFYRFDPAGFADAERCFREALTRDANYALARSGLGSVLMFRYIARGVATDLDAAVTELEDARRLDGRLVEPWIWLTYAYTRQARWALALETGEAAVAREPTNPMTHYFLGGALQSRALETHEVAHIPAAVAAMQRTIALDPSYQPAQMILASLMCLQGAYAAADEPLAQAEATERAGGGRVVQFVGASALRAWWYLRLGDIAEAGRAAESASARLSMATHVYAPFFAGLALLLRGEVALRQRNAVDALAHFASAMAQADAAPNSTGMGHLSIRARCGSVRALVAAGRAEDAQLSLSAAIRLFANRAGSGFLANAWDAADVFDAADFAAAHAAVGEAVAAAQWLAQARAWGWNDTGYAHGIPEMAELLANP